MSFIAAIDSGEWLYKMESFNESKFLRFRSPLGIVCFSRRFRVVSMNKRAQRFWNVKLSPDMFPPCKTLCPFRESAPICRSCVARRAIQDGKVHRSVNRCSKGEMYLLTGFPAKDGEGAIVGAVMSLENITSRAGLEDQLQYSERYLEMILSSLSEWLFALDSEGSFLTVNKAMVKASGIGQKAFRSMTLFDLLILFIERPLKFIFPGRSPVRNIENLKPHAGPSMAASYMVHSGFFPVPLRGVARVFGTIQELSSTLQRKRELEALKKVIEWNSEVLLISNEEGKIIYVSDSAKDMIGGSNKVLLGRDIYKLLKLTRPIQFAPSNSDQNVRNMEYRSKAAGAETLTYRLSIRFMYEKGNELCGCVVLGHRLDGSSP